MLNIKSISFQWLVLCLVPVSINTWPGLGTLPFHMLTSAGNTQLVFSYVWSRLAKTLPNNHPKTLQPKAQTTALHSPTDFFMRLTNDGFQGVFAC